MFREGVDSWVVDQGCECLRRLRGAGVCELIGQAAAKSARFGKDFFAGLFIQSEHEFLVFQGTQAGHVILIIDENDGSGRPEQFQDAGACLWVQFLAATLQQKPLQEAIGEQYEDNLVNNNIEGA
ncbi:MAG: hypothetical protein ABR903_09180 [Thermodesulfovibrionales bacterium]